MNTSPSSTAVFLHCPCLPPLLLLSPSASAPLHRRCLPPPPLPPPTAAASPLLLRPPIPAASPDSCCLPPFLLRPLLAAAFRHRFWPSLPGLRLPQLLPIPPTSAAPTFTGANPPPPHPPGVPPPPLVLPTPTGRRSHSGDRSHRMVWQDTWVRNGRKAAPSISGGGRPPLEGTTSNDSNARRRWCWLAHVRGGDRRRSCMAVMCGAAATMAHPCQMPSPTESMAAYRVK